MTSPTLPDTERVPLPALITTNGLMSELGVSRHEAERIMRAVPRRVQFVKGGRVYAYRTVVEPPPRSHVAAMRRNITGPWLLAFDILEATGIRVGELRDATFGDLDTRDHRFRVAVDGKTRGSLRWASIPPHVLQRLLDTVAPEDRVAERPLIAGLTDHGMRKRMREACKQAGIPLYSPHDLRHRWVSLALRRGVPLAEVSRTVGHARQSMTVDNYSHVVLEPGDLEPLAWSDE